MSHVINVFKCIVNISSQDFGVYFRGKANFGVRGKMEQHGDSEKAVNDESGVVMESGWMVGGDVGWFCAMVAFLDAVGWVGELRSLLGWLWRQWIFTLEGRWKFCRIVIWREQTQNRANANRTERDYTGKVCEKCATQRNA